MKSELGVVERTLVIQALREAASYTRIVIRRKAYLDLAKRLREENDEKNS